MNLFEHLYGFTHPHKNDTVVNIQINDTTPITLLGITDYYYNPTYSKPYNKYNLFTISQVYEVKKQMNII